MFLREVGNDVSFFKFSVKSWQILDFLEIFEIVDNLLLENRSDSLNRPEFSLSSDHDSFVLSLLSLEKSLGSLIFSLRSNELFSLSELLIDIFNANSLSLHPGIAQNFSHRWSIGWVRSKQSGEQVNQLRREKSLGLALLMGFPEFILLSCAEASVVGASLLVSLAEGRMSSERNK